MHQNVDCKGCHSNLVFANVSTKCSTCHADFHRRQMGTNCEQCHTVRGWKVAASNVQDHRNRFPLVGAHAAANCESCHKGAATSVFTGLSTECVSCHLQDYRQAANFDHVAAGVPTTCETCHSMDAWAGARFDHNRFARFPLAGAHAKLDCASCHTGRVFKSVSADCYGCHASVLASTKNPDHVAAGFPRDCAVCHSVDRWQGARFDHNASTRFSLVGAHTKATCVSCHVGGRFAGTASDCYGCHVKQFESVSDPDHRRSRFSTNCETCHTVDSWQGAKYDHNLSRFALTGAHTRTACLQCHVGSQYIGTPLECASCHRKDFDQVSSPNHVAAGFPLACLGCHTTEQWKGAKFDHNISTKFALTGRHATATCQQCHSNGRYAGLAQDCASCHLDVYRTAKNPDHASSGFPSDCTLCHTTAQWSGARFDHNTTTKFPLTGKHSSATCQSCHVNNRFIGLAQDCASCHLNDFNASTNPSHRSAGFSTECATCHATAQWKGAKFDHNTATRFALTGKHTTTACQSCHSNNRFAGMAQDCAGCHLDDFNRAADPNHKTAGFPSDCTTCHNTTQWKGAKFDHNAATKFALTGKHTAIACQQCHVSNRFAGTAQDCASCHVTDYNATANPNHKSAGFSTTCTNCHTTVQWKGAKFDHNTSTKFPLTGKHSSAACQSCHLNNRFAGTALDCASCHLDEFNRTTDPNHKSAGFPINCTTCHNTAQWKGAKFDHNTGTKFPLTGKHATTACQSCHVNNRFAGTAQDCASCHLDDFNKTSNPNHKAAGFPLSCTTCHTTAQWKGAKFDHNTATKFPLTGRHTAAACQSCHVSNRFAGTAQDCAGCHLDAFNATSNPNHKSAGFSTACATCHSTAQWKGAMFNHSTATKFPLTGKHTTAACQSCHVNNRFAGTAQDCASCHLNDYNGTTNPGHKTAGFPTACATCHTTTQWKGAIFNHNAATKFPLTGKHTTAACQSCHVNNRFAGTPQDCASCHLDSFNGTTNPNHKSAGFPTACATCHTTAQWTGAKFDHNTATKFPLTGKHTTAACQACHVSNRFAGTAQDCAGCHIDDYNGTTNPGHKSAGFSTSCSTCHTTAQWKGAKFDHALTKFPLTGKHTAAACQSCHVNNRFAGTAQDCAGCHLDSYNGTTNPNHKSAGFPTACVDLSHHRPMDWCEVRSQHCDQVPPHRQTHRHRLPILPRKQPFRRHCAGLRRVPPR